MRRGQAMVATVCGGLLVVGALLDAFEARGDVLGGGFLRRFFVNGTARPEVSEINTGTGLTVTVTGNRATINATGGGGPTGSAGGDLTGTYPNPTIATGAVSSAKILDGTITDSDVALANKDGSANVPSMRTLGTSATQCLAGTTPLYSRIQKDSANLDQYSILNFIGSGMTCSNNVIAGRTDCTILGAYDTIGVNGASQTHFGRLNFVNTSVLTWSAGDNGGTNSTDLTPTVVTSPSGQTPVGVTRAINCGTGLSGCGNLSADRTLSVTAFRGVAAATRITTTDATPTTCVTVTMPSGPAEGRVVAQVGVQNNAETAGGGYQRTASFRVSTGGTVTFSGLGVGNGGQGDIEDGAVSAADVTMDVSSGTVRVRVTGIAGTLSWTCSAVVF